MAALIWTTSAYSSLLLVYRALPTWKKRTVPGPRTSSKLHELCATSIDFLSNQNICCWFWISLLHWQSYAMQRETVNDGSVPTRQIERTAELNHIRPTYILQACANEQVTARISNNIARRVSYNTRYQNLLMPLYPTSYRIDHSLRCWNPKRKLTL